MTHIFKIGDVVEIDTRDPRKWVRFKCWLMRRPVPFVKVKFIIKDSTIAGITQSAFNRLYGPGEGNEKNCHH